MIKQFNELANAKRTEKTISALKENGINAFLVETKEQAKEKVLQMIPKGAEVFSMTSITLEAMGIPKEINESKNYDSVRNKLISMTSQNQSREMQKLGSAPDWTIGSVHAVTEDGKLMIASNTGSQLPAYAYGAENVIFLVGTQKIVKNMEQGFERIYNHSLPLESERAKKAYGIERSNVSKILIINKEIQQNRITLIFINEILGF
ncbi:LUD domain-containing protein [Candidatus Pacearchaeota archaeon]|nr:LUD domain-containing protein [Candidatus Pacearchaeota archaeon]